MSLTEKIEVNTHYTRSVNLERDASSVNVVKAYIPTSRALRTFSKISETFHGDQAPRAWSLVGPYGSGKSSFSVFLSELLGNPDSDSARAAQEVLSSTDGELGERFTQQTCDSSGYLRVLITGSPEPLGKRVAEGFAKAAEAYWAEKSGRKPQVISKLAQLIESDTVASSELLPLIEELKVALLKIGAPGILLIIDELGKFLEYEARHYGANDIYLLQELAEKACGGGDCNLLMFVLLHQSFEQYAKGLGESLKNEWSKVQGRFEEVPFLESVEQVLRVVSAALSHNLSAAELKLVRQNVSIYLQPMIAMEALPGAMIESEALDLFQSCYPLHPVTAVLLPHLCQKVAQNERTLFSYLGSHEEYGLLDMINKFDGVDEYILPHHIYDYFINNQPAVVGDYLTHRRWAEVVTAIERIGDVEPQHIDLLKSIGILNIIGSKGGFKAAAEILLTTQTNKASLEESIKVLQGKSVVTFRKYNNEYRVWQGSDFDLEAAMDEELSTAGNFSLAEVLNTGKSLPPVVARRYTVESGTLRYFEPYFIDAQNYKEFQKRSIVPRILFFLSGGQDDEKLFAEVVCKSFSDIDLVVLCLSGNQLRDAVSETQALKSVQINRQELNTDPIAKREFEDRLTAAEQSQSNALQALVDSPEVNRWYHKGILKVAQNKRALQHLMSEVLNDAYHCAPTIHNELVNRDSPSATANGARNKLVWAMFQKEGKPNLGMPEKEYPPEKAIYLSVLQATGLHREGKGESWSFMEPETEAKRAESKYSQANIAPVWQKINEFLDTTETEPKSIIELNEILRCPPYGVKAGLLPILYLAVYQVYSHELAVYENRIYKPSFTQEMTERFLKKPNEFTFQRFKIQGVNKALFNGYIATMFAPSGKPEKKPSKTVLQLAAPLAGLMANLPDYTKTTRRGISDRAIQVRMAFDLAKSPQRLLLQDIPKALGFKDLDRDVEDSTLAEFSQRFRETLSEFNNAYPALLDKQQQLLAQAFSKSPTIELSDLRAAIFGKCHGLEQFTVDTQGLRAFIQRLISKEGNDNEWFENVLMFLGHKPPKKWTDSDQDAAEHRLNDLSRRVVDLEKLSITFNEKRKGFDSDFDVYLLRSVKRGGGFIDETVAVDTSTAGLIKDTKKGISKILNDMSDKELQLAALAQLVDEFLVDYREGQKTTKGKKTKFKKHNKDTKPTSVKSAKAN